MKPEVPAAKAQKLLVRALFANAASGHDEDAIARADG
jgi:hypothetical protein